MKPIYQTPKLNVSGKVQIVVNTLISLVCLLLVLNSTKSYAAWLLLILGIVGVWNVVSKIGKPMLILAAGEQGIQQLRGWHTLPWSVIQELKTARTSGQEALHFIPTQGAELGTYAKGWLNQKILRNRKSKQETFILYIAPRGFSFEWDAILSEIEQQRNGA